jgi:rhamnogalacturonan endolyase
MRPLILISLASLAAPAAENFVPVRGDGRVLDFEMADAPVTNAEYALFVRATRHAAPQHWEQGSPPRGFENHPVIYVNRYDVEKYLAWRSANEKRIYRLPYPSEFEYAARAGRPNAVYPWGDEAPKDQANFDSDGSRSYPEWRKHLKAVRSYAPNPWKLYDLAGNVWQMVETDHDPATQRWIFRIHRPVQKESTVMGGSWARSAPYLKIGVRGGAGGAGIRHPDLGFRLVREPLNSTHFKRQVRRVMVVRTAGGMHVSWQLLPGEEGMAFNVYRATRRDVAGTRLNKQPLAGPTAFLDREASEGRAYYRVRPELGGGTEGAPSEWGAEVVDAKGLAIAARFEPGIRQGGATPIFGDLNGDGLLDAVFREDNLIQENRPDPGVPVELEAFASYGKQLWRRPLISHNLSYGNANNAPVLIYDLDGDGRAEVAARVEEGGQVWLAILDGMTGETRKKVKWPAMFTDTAGTSTRIHMSVAYLDGKRPSLITQTGLYENELFHAWDAELRLLWKYESSGATSGSGSHHIDIADVDGDGRDEVFDGTTLLNPDGTLRWSLYRLHPDIVAIKHILGNQDRQVYYAVESSTHAGAYVVDAKTGKLHWKINREDDPRWGHAHIGWAADIWEGSPGYELLTNTDGHEAKDSFLFSSTGKVLMNPLPGSWRPVNWLGRNARELLSTDGKRLMKFNGSGLEAAGPAPAPEGCRVLMAADLWGDYRDEIVCAATIDGRMNVLILANTAEAPARGVTRTSSREYRLWLARNMGAGYASYFEWEEGH